MESESKDNSTRTRLQESGVDGVGSRGLLARTFLIDIKVKSMRSTHIIKLKLFRAFVSSIST